MAAAVADRLRWPLVTQVARLTLEGTSIRAKRQTESGYDVIEAPLPAVVSVADSINDPRYPSLKAIMGAKKKPQETLSAGDLGISDSPRTEVLELSSPPAKGWRETPRGRWAAPRPSRSSSSSSSGRSSSDGRHPGLRRAARGRVRAWLARTSGRGQEPRRGSRRAGGRRRLRLRPRRCRLRGARRIRRPRAVVLADHEALAAGLPQPAVDAIARVVADGGYSLVLFGASVLASDIAAGLSARLDAGLIVDAIELHDARAAASSPAGRVSETRLLAHLRGARGRRR